MTAICMHGVVSGRVQGVWYRGFVKQQALAHQLSGWAKNLDDGRVEVLLCGEQQAVEAVVDSLRTGPPMSRVDAVAMRLCSDFPVVTGFQTL
jgi:acylphosphatase